MTGSQVERITFLLGTPVLPKQRYHSMQTLFACMIYSRLYPVFVCSEVLASLRKWIPIVKAPARAVKDEAIAHKSWVVRFILFPWFIFTTFVSYS